MAVPEGLGLHVDLVNPLLPKELQMLEESGVRWVRQDFLWNATENQKGEYDFSAYERRLQALKAHGLKPIWILCYGNPGYDGGQAPHSDEARAAFTRWAVAAGKRFAGNQVVWEIWNEPNDKTFWAPKPSSADYARLAREVTQAFQKELPGETLVGPAGSRFPRKFYREILKAGAPEGFAAFTVHPYRPSQAPETAEKDYRWLRRALERYGPPGRQIPIWAAEWGYSTLYPHIDELEQAKYLARSWLFNYSQGIPVSIWFNWRDGPSPSDPVHRFGVVEYADLPSGLFPYRPKPAYFAVKTLTSVLKDFHFFERLKTKSGKDYFLSLKSERGNLRRFVAWTTAKGEKKLQAPLSPGRYEVVDFLGNRSHWEIEAGKKPELLLKDSPQYFIPLSPKCDERKY